MVTLAGAAIAAGLIEIRTDLGVDLTPWLMIELIGGTLAGAGAGLVCRWCSGRSGPVRVLAGAVLVLGLLEGIEILRAGSAAVPALGVAAPLIVAMSVLAGGGGLPTRAGIMSLARRVSAGSCLRFGAPALVLAAACGVAVFVLPTLAAESEPRVVAAALAVDFAVAPPVLVYLLLVRAKRLPLIAVVPAFAAGYALAWVAMPGSHRDVLEGIRLAAIPLELGLVAYLVVAARRAWGSATHEAGDFVTRLRSAARRSLGSRVAAAIITTEVSLLYHALRGRRATPEEGTVFSMHREAGYLPVLGTLLAVLAIETVPMHLLISRWSDAAAWGLTALSLYAVLWVVGDYRAIVGRATRLTSSVLQVRLGVRWEADIPRHVIESVERAGAAAEARGTDSLMIALLGVANVQVTLREPIEVTGMYGLRRRARVLLLRVDRPEELVANLTARNT